MWLGLGRNLCLGFLVLIWNLKVCLVGFGVLVNDGFLLNVMWNCLCMRFVLVMVLVIGCLICRWVFILRKEIVLLVVSRNFMVVVLWYCILVQIDCVVLWKCVCCFVVKLGVGVFLMSFWLWCCSEQLWLLIMMMLLVLLLSIWILMCCGFFRKCFMKYLFWLNVVIVFWVVVLKVLVMLDSLCIIFRLCLLLLNVVLMVIGSLCFLVKVIVFVGLDSGLLVFVVRGVLMC